MPKTKKLTANKKELLIFDMIYNSFISSFKIKNHNHE